MLPWNPPASAFGNPPPPPSHDPHSNTQQPPNQQPVYRFNQGGGANPGPPPNEQAPNAGPPPPAPQTLSSVLHFLQTEHRRYARDRNEWEIERAEMRARIALLEGEKRGNEGALRDLGRRCKMLENALRGERSKFLSSTAAGGSLANLVAQSPSGTSSPIHIPPSANATGTTNAATGKNLLKEAVANANTATDTAPSSSPMAPSTSSQGAPASTTTAPPITIAAPTATLGGTAPGLMPGQAPGSRASSSLGVNGFGTMGGGGLHTGRDPRGRARSRDYLKACLQEITYLTSSTTLNPLAPASHTAPNIPRPRKVLPEFALPPVTGPSGAPINTPGIINLPLPPHSQAQSQPQSHPPSQPPATLASSAEFSLPSSASSTSTAAPTEGAAPPTSNPAPAAALTAFPSDPASAYVPLKRVISSPGIPAPLSSEAIPTTPSSSTSALPAATEADPFEPVVEKPESGDRELKTEKADETPSKTSSTSSSSSTVAARVDPGARDGNDERTSSGSIGIDAPKPAQSGSPFDEPRIRERRGAGAGGDGGGEDGGEDGDEGGAGAMRLTAIFKPESDEGWRERLRAAGESIGMSGETLGKKNGGVGASVGGDKGLEELKWDLDESSEEEDGTRKGVRGKKGVSEVSVGWKGRKTLRSHLDAVRALGFGEDGLTIVSGGDDMTVKLWRLDPDLLSPTGKALGDPEPVKTYREHSAPVTSVLVSSSTSRLYSASLDSTINVWSLPPADQNTYGPFDASLHEATYVGHTDAVWGLVFVGEGDRLLASISADGTTKVWDTTKLDSLLLSWDYYGVGGEGKKKKPAPTAVCRVGKDKVAVAYQDSVVKLFDVESGKEVGKLESDETFDGTPGTQINAVLAHPTLPVIYTAHEDKLVRVFDIETGKCTRSHVTHLDGVTSLDLDPSGQTLITSSHDSSLRFWDLATFTCVQEISAHRPNSNAEGILDVKFHPSINVAASGGSDGQIKLWAK